MYMIFQKTCKKILKHISLCFFALLICSCNYIEKKKLQLTIKHEYGRTLDFSWSGNRVLADTVISGFEIQKPITIVSYIDSKLCPECFSKYLKGAEKYVNRFHSDKVQYVCITYPRNIEDIQFAVTLSEVNPDKVMVVYDTDNEYLTINKIDKLAMGYNVFLVDSNHKIVLIGDPIRSESMYDYCKETIVSMLDEL